MNSDSQGPELRSHLIDPTTLDQVERWLRGPLSPRHDRLLSDLTLFTSPALWPHAQLAMVLHEALAYPRGFVGWVCRRNPLQLDRLLARAHRRIHAFGLSGSLPSGAAWRDQLARLRQMTTALSERALEDKGGGRTASLQLARTALALSHFLVNHPICGTPEAHTLRNRIELALSIVQARSTPREILSLRHAG
jgi:predicted RNA polymerase sigma factor